MSLLYFVRLLALILVSTLGVACITFSTSNLSTFDAEKARKFSDAFLEDAVNGRQDALYSKMENEFRQTTSREKFRDLVSLFDVQFGRIIDYTFDHDEIGTKVLFNGKVEPTCKIVQWGWNEHQVITELKCVIQNEEKANRLFDVSS